MFERFDNFAGQYIETTETGWRAIQSSITNIGKFLSMLLLVIVSSLIMVFMFPLWLLGKLSAQQSVHADAGDSAVSTSIVHASAKSKSRKVTKRTQRG